MTPRIATASASALVAFVRDVFGASGEYTAERPSILRLGDSMLMIGDATARGPFAAFLYVYVEDVEGSFARALAAGAQALEEPCETPYGERRATFRDPWGNLWQVAALGKQVLPEPDTRERGEAVSLVAARTVDRELLANLLELYVHDMSAAFPSVVLGPEGRFGYAKLPLYFAEPDRRFPFLIRYGERVAGFALATRGSPVADDPSVCDVAEFFVLRQFRRLGVGRCAAQLLWSRLPGSWTVRVSETNAGGLEFWRDVTGAAARLPPCENTRVIGATTWRVFSFDTGSAGRPGDGASRDQE